MKQGIVMSIIATVIIAFSACIKDTASMHYKVYSPVIESMKTIRGKVQTNSPFSVVQPGKIAVIGDYLLVTEKGSGVHVFNNQNPSAPVNVSFINIPGNNDISVRGNYLYADCYTDLLVIDISDKTNPKLVNYVADVFKDKRYYYGYSTDSGNVITSLIEKDTIVNIDANGRDNYWVYSSGGDVFLSTSSPGGMANNVSTSLANSKNGSMARFTLVNDRLYTVQSYYLTSFNVSNAAMPVSTGSLYITNNIETIYPFRDKLFIGSQSGMFIYDISNADHPVFTGNFTHARLCDPVITDGNYAYITLHASENICVGTDNELDVVDVKNMQSPVLIKKYNMTKPMGLGKDNDNLFVCDNGLKIYNASKPDSLALISTINITEPYDIICLNGTAIVSAKDGLYQYNYTDIHNIIFLSKISLNQ